MSKQRERRRHRDGRWIEEEYVVEDQGEVRVPIMLADGPPRKWPGWVSPLTDAEVKLLDQHKSGFRTADQLSDRQLKAGAEIAAAGVMGARDAWIEQMSDAWKLDARKRKSDPDEDDPDDPDSNEDDRSRDSRALADVRAPAIEARARWVRGLQDAWKKPAPSLATPSPQLTHDRSLGPHGPAIRDAVAGKPEPPDKEAMYAQRCRDLENAWRSPAGAGPGKVGAGPSWKGAGA
jgi:hypothetical protein